MVLIVIIGVAALLGILRLKDALVDFAARDFRRDAVVGRTLRNLVVVIVGLFWVLYYLGHSL